MAAPGKNNQQGCQHNVSGPGHKMTSYLLSRHSICNYADAKIGTINRLCKVKGVLKNILAFFSYICSWRRATTIGNTLLYKHHNKAEGIIVNHVKHENYTLMNFG